MVYSDIGEIVLDGLMVVQQPEDYIGKVGDTVTFSVAARGDGLSYQWQSSTNGGSSWHNSTAGGYATATARVTMTEGNPGYLYRCKITDSAGNVIYSEPGEIVLLSETWRYSYNADGLRTSRTDRKTTYSYVYNGSSLTRMTVGSDTLTFGYDASGKPLFVQWNNSRYFYATNLQGDVVAIVSVNGIPVVEYTYDAWGNTLSITGTRADNLGKLNPLRYRGYVYDTETGLYYLQSRYYDPEMGRFISADVFVSTGQGLLGNNMFAYCLNNPVVCKDITGHKPTYTLDTDGDGKDDCFVYVYHYHKRVRRKNRRLRGYTINTIGKVYIFVGRRRSDFEDMGYPDGFNIYTDLMVLDQTQSSAESMYAYQAQYVLSRYHSHIIECMKQYDTDFDTPWDRSEESLLVEWRSHNLFAPFDKSAQDVDFDNAEEGFSYWDYVNKAFTRAIEKYF